MYKMKIICLKRDKIQHIFNQGMCYKSKITFKLCYVNYDIEIKTSRTWHKMHGMMEHGNKKNPIKIMFRIAKIQIKESTEQRRKCAKHSNEKTNVSKEQVKLNFLISNAFWTHHIQRKQLRNANITTGVDIIWKYGSAYKHIYYSFCVSLCFISVCLV